MNWLSNLWSNLWRSPAPPAPKPVPTMITSSPAESAKPAPQPDVVRLSKPPSLKLQLTQGAAMGPLLIGNNSAGLKPRNKLALTNSAPIVAERGPALVIHGQTDLGPVLSFWYGVQAWLRWPR